MKLRVARKVWGRRIRHSEAYKLRTLETARRLLRRALLREMCRGVVDRQSGVVHVYARAARKP